MGSLLVVTGPPGVGKSSVAQGLADLHDRSALIDGDVFYAFLRNGAISPWLREAHDQNLAVTSAAAAASGRLAGHCDVVYDGVLGPWFLDLFLKGSGREALDYVVLLPPLAVCLDRVKNRQDHAFTDLEATEHMWKVFSRATIDPRHVFDDGEPAPADLARIIAERRADGSLRYP